MTNREYMQSLDDAGFFDMIKSIAFNPLFKYMDWVQWLRDESSVSEEVKHETSVLVSDKLSSESESAKPTKSKPKPFKPTSLTNCKYAHSRMARSGRNAAQLSARQVAEAMGVSVSTIHNFECGNGVLSDTLARAYAAVVGIDEDELIRVKKANVLLEAPESNEVFVDLEPVEIPKPVEVHEPDLSNLAKMLTQAMHYQNLSVDQCASGLGVSPITVLNWISGNTIPSYNKTSDIVNFFDFDFGEYCDARRDAKGYNLDSQEQYNRQDIIKFGQLVQSKRLERSWSTLEVDKRLGFKSGTTVLVENGKAGVPMSMLQKFTKLFDFEFEFRTA